MRYNLLLNSQWFGSNEPSKLKVRKKTFLVWKSQEKSKFKIQRFVTPRPLGVKKQIVPHLKALICGYLEPKGRRAWQQNKAATPTWVKKVRVSFKWAWLLCFAAKPLAFLAPRSHILGLSNDISFLSEFQLLLPKFDQNRQKNRPENMPVRGHLSISVHIANLCCWYLYTYSSDPNSSPGHSYYFLTFFLPGHPY